MASNGACASRPWRPSPCTHTTLVIPSSARVRRALATSSAWRSIDQTSPASRASTRGVIARAGSDVEHPVGGGQLEQLEHPGDDHRLGDRLAAVDRQGHVLVGATRVLRADEALARHGQQGVEHPPVSRSCGRGSRPGSARRPSRSAIAGRPTSVRPMSRTDAVPPTADPAPLKGQTTIVEPSRAERSIARRTAEVRATVPDLELSADVDAGALLAATAAGASPAAVLVVGVRAGAARPSARQRGLPGRALRAVLAGQRGRHRARPRTGG